MTLICIHAEWCDDGPMAQEMADWLLAVLDRDSGRLLDVAREAAGAPGGQVVTRLSMDQFANIQAHRKILEIANEALSEGGGPRFTQIVAWLAYARQAAPGYLETWAPEEIDLIATLDDYGDPSDE